MFNNHVFDRISNKRVREWYSSHVNSSFLKNMIDHAENDGYNLDTESGLLTREPFSKETTNVLGYTALDIIFLRPTDLHYHKDVDEAIFVEDGKGLVVFEDFDYDTIKVFRNKLYRGKSIIIGKQTNHAFRPDKGNFLEVRVSCSGILDPEKEVCMIPFDKFWKKYHSK